MSNYLVEQKKEKAQKTFESVLKSLNIEEPNFTRLLACYKEQWDIIDEVYYLNQNDISNVSRKLEKHCESIDSLKDHVSESVTIRDKVNGHESELKNINGWVSRLEENLKEAIRKIDGLPWKVLFAVSIPIIISTLLILLRN